MTAASDRRNAERSRLPMAVRCTLSAGESVEVSLVEASLSGCQVVTGTALEEGACILITPPAMHALAGRVRWATADAAGIEFEVPLPAVVLKHLLYEPDDGEAWEFVDAFGRPLPLPRRHIQRAVRL